MQPQHQRKRPWPAPEAPDLAVPAGMRRERFRAMGTTISLLLPAPRASRGAMAVQDLFVGWEHALSRFRPESELSALNAQAGEPVAVSSLLYHVITVALEMARATDGLFDPTMLRQLVSLGYDRSFDVLPLRLPGSLTVAGPGGGWRAIELEPTQRRVTLPHGISLDLGGIAKGMAVDAALTHLQTLDVDAALVNAGGDLGVLGQPPSGEPWAITVPLRRGTWTIVLQRGTLATSSVARRRWRQDGQQRHHLLDPRSGLPARSGLWSVSVGAEQCVQAEVAAKVAYVLGPFAGARFLAAHSLPGLLVQENGAWHTTEGWPTPSVREGSLR